MVHNSNTYREALLIYLESRIEHIKRQKNDNNFGWNTLAKELGYDGKKFRLWKNGKQHIKFNDLVKISDYFNTTPAMLVNSMETICNTRFSTGLLDLNTIRGNRPDLPRNMN